MSARALGLRLATSMPGSALSLSSADHGLTRKVITDRLAELDAIADRYLESERPRTTRDAYAQDWTTWQDYTRWAAHCDPERLGAR
jgi:hypothetical protein